MGPRALRGSTLDLPVRLGALTCLKNDPTMDSGPHSGVHQQGRLALKAKLQREWVLIPQKVRRASCNAFQGRLFSLCLSRKNAFQGRLVLFRLHPDNLLDCKSGLRYQSNCRTPMCLLCGKSVKTSNRDTEYVRRL